MSINIKNREAEELVAELKRRTGKGATALLLDLLRLEKSRIDTEFEARLREAAEEDRQLRERWLSHRLVDARSAEEILDHDENGLPR